MKKYVLPFLLLLIFVFSPVYGEENTTEQRVTVFIDISGSMYPVFAEIKQAVLDEVFSDLEIGTELTIYKFYRKIVPIYEGRLKRKSDIDYAKSRVLALKANGPWTDIQKVLTHIQEHQTENDHYLIFTDGKHETEDSLHDFQLTEAILKEQLGTNIKIIKKDTWEMIDYVYKLPVVQKPSEVITPPVPETKEPVKQPIPAEAVTERTSFNLWWLILIILIIVAAVVGVYVLLYYLLPRVGIPMRVLFEKVELDPKTGIRMVCKRVRWTDGSIGHRRFPKFKSEFTIKLPKNLHEASDIKQFTECNQKFKEKFNTDDQFRNNILQQVDILVEKYNKLGYEGWESSQMFIDEVNKGHTPPGFVWHHHEHKGIMQLVLREDHENIRHEGGKTLWGKGNR